MSIRDEVVAELRRRGAPGVGVVLDVWLEP